MRKVIDFVVNKADMSDMLRTKKFLLLLVNYINFTAVLALIPLLLFPYTPVTLTFFYVFFVSYLIEIVTDKKWKNFRFDKIKLYYTVMAMFFLLAIIYLPFEKTNTHVSTLLERRLPLIGFAVVGFLGVNRLYKLNYFLYTFILATVTAILYVLYRIGIQEITLNSEFFRLFTEKQILYVGSHMKVNFYLNISIIGLWYILRNDWKTVSRWTKTSLIAALAMMLMVLVTSEGRTGFFAGALLCLVFIFIEIYTRWKKAGVVCILVFSILFGGAAILHQRLTIIDVASDPRTFLWKSAWEVIKERPLLGYGINDAQAEFDEKKELYQTASFQQYSIYMEQTLNEKYQDSHNQYLQAMMEFGILGLILLLFLFVFPIFAVDKNKRLFTVFIVFLYMFLSIFDVYVTRLYAPVFGILTLMMLVAESNKKTKTEKHAVVL